MEATFIFSDPRGPMLNTSYFRIFGPAQALQAAGHTIHVVEGGTMRASGPQQEEGDVIDYTQVTETVLIERELSPDRVRKLRYAGAQRIVLTYDDHYGKMPAWAARKAFWETPGRYPDWVKAHELVDAVIVASDKLAHANIAPNGAPVRYVPNFLDSALWTGRYRESLFQPLVIGWGGTKEHRGSWEQSPVLAALRDLQSERGYISLRMIGHVADTHLAKSGVRFEGYPWQEYALWPKLAASFDIGLAPLRGEYDTYRSNLKVLEYASLGIPWIASDMSPYEQAQGGILIRSDKREGERWLSALRILLDDPALYQKLSDEGRAWAAQYSLEHCVPLYEEILWPKK